MVRNSTVGSLPLGLSSRFLSQCCSSLLACLLVFCGLAMFGGPAIEAQSLTGGGISGTVSDPDGRAVAKATVTATNTDTGVQTTAISGTAGNYTIQPLQAGPYNVEVTAKGFSRLLQENVTVDNASVLGLPLKLTVGGESTTVTVTDAPAMLDTTDATLGGTIENELYSSLPLSMNGGPRDPTAFQYLMPGVQENPANNSGTGANNGNSGIYGGSSATNLNENYLEGMSVTNVSQQGSSNPISGAVSVDAVDQFSVATSGASASFGGAGSTNYTIKSGGNQFHGTVFDFVRNTAFDTWGYFAKVPASTGFAVKPGEHQNSYGGSVGGPILKDKLFFFSSYEGYHYTNISNTPQYITIPTVQERTGNFTDVLGTSSANIINPTTGSHPAFQGLLNGVPTYNVIEPQYLSSISLYLQSALPQPTNLSTFNNYLASLPQANTDYNIDARLDYTINQRNKFSVVSVGGNIGFGGAPDYSTQTQLTVPYAAGQFTNQKTASGVLSYVYIASQSLINSLKYLYSRNWGNGFSLTANKTNPLMPAPQNTGCPAGNENSCAAGINNLPAGNASDSMPAVSFGQSNGPTTPSNWASTSSSGPRATNTYEAQDELQWIRGRHNIKFGAVISWLQTNGGSFGGFSKTLSLTYDADDTEVGTTNTGTSGDAYASFLIGAVNSGGVSVQDIQDVGGRFRQPALYVQDNWQASPKLTLNLGMRYDYLQPYHEVKDRISFLNVNKINPITGTPGVLMYAGFPDPANFPAIPANSAAGIPAQTAAQVFAQYSPYICHCTTPVKPYNKNLEPRIGFSYAYTPTTVFSGAFSINLTRAGGAGGGSGATAGTGNNGEFGASTTTSQTGSSNSYQPGFYLNPGLTSTPSQTSQNQGTQPAAVNGVNGPLIPCVANNTCSALSAIPPWTVPGVSVNPLASTGNYNYQSFFPDHLNDYGCGTNGPNCNAGSINYADPYYGGRGPQFISYNFSVQRMINKKAVLTIAYSGSQTHFLPKGAGRGYATNGISPDYGQEFKGALGGNFPGLYNCGAVAPVACTGFTGSGATLMQALKPFPQFGTMTDLWGETGNAAYNSLQVSVIQRPWHNLSGFMNYTRAKELDDTGNHRSQYPIGPQDGNFSKTYSANQIDRSLGTSNQTNQFNLTWVYSFPIGRGQAFFATNRIAGLIGGGWQVSGIYKYRDGYPLQIGLSSCNASTNAGQGSCMPDYTPGFDKRKVRINGRWGRGPGANAASLGQISYINAQAFQCPDSSPTNTGATCGNTNSPTATWKIGNVARTAPDGLHGPGWWDIDMGLRRTFNVRETATLHLTFQFEADVTNATNSTFFNLSGQTSNSSGFGAVGGQNKSILPRDWQFAGRFRF
jgi:Carboxypeptidase regulatory-like domain